VESWNTQKEELFIKKDKSNPEKPSVFEPEILSNCKKGESSSCYFLDESERFS
jgi:hypothetical protein